MEYKLSATVFLEKYLKLSTASAKLAFLCRKMPSLSNVSGCDTDSCHGRKG